MVRYIGQCQLCSFETEPLDDKLDAKLAMTGHIEETHVDDYIDANTKIIETEEAP
jgi:hypothetical protein